jgi:hypothetical protein
MAPRQQWRAKEVSETLKETRVEAAEDQEVADTKMLVETKDNRSVWHDAPVGPVEEGSAQDQLDRPITPIKPINEVLVQIGAEVPAPSQSCSKVPAPADDKEEMLDYEPSPIREDMDVNIIYLSSVDYSLVGDDEVAEMRFGPCDAIFQRPKDSENHLKLLYIQGHFDGTPLSQMLVDGGAIINLMAYSFFKKMGKSNKELIKTNMTINDVSGGDPIGAKGVASMELTVGRQDFGYRILHRWGAR